MLSLGLLAVLVAGCGGSAGGAAGGEAAEGADGAGRIEVAATISVIGDLAEEVAGERAEIFTIVPAGTDVHTFQPSPSDAQRISESGIVFQNGLGLEEWTGDLIEGAGEDVRVVELAEGMQTLGGEEHGEERNGEHGEEEEHSGANPHLWLDVENAGIYVEKIRDTLVEVDPEGAETYRANAEEYLEELEALDDYVAERAASIPEDRRKLVTLHAAFPYFAEAYGFEMVDVILQNPEAEPSAREAAELVREIEVQGVPAVFTEPQLNQSLANTIADEAGVEVYALYSDALADDPDVDSYEEMMTVNIDRVVEGLGR